MRLLNTQTLHLTTHNPPVPPYAILSHTWASTELTYDDMVSSPPSISPSTIASHAKIRLFCAAAREAGYDYAWVDTCCIDKRSSAELSEAINAMYTWYQRAGVCMAYLADVVVGGSDSSSGDEEYWGSWVEMQLRQSRWFTRGWTLQELIAPTEVKFYDRNWRYIASKADLSGILAEITMVEEGVLLGTTRCEDVLIGKRMSWAAGRTTTREEDMAYCLLGIFDVNMPLLYGEGAKAFVRLQEEIIRSTIDLSIFAWRTSGASQAYHGLLASAPALFADCNDLVPSNSYFMPYANELVIANGRLRVQRMLRISDAAEAPEREFILPLRCRLSTTSAECLILLRQCGSSLFVRSKAHLLCPVEVEAEKSYRANVHVPQYILLRDSLGNSEMVAKSRRNAIFLRLPEELTLLVRGQEDLYPWPRWDNYNRLLLSNGEDEFWGKCTLALKSDLPHTGRQRNDVKQPELAVIICGRASGDVGFFCGVALPYDHVPRWLPQHTSDLELMTALSVSGEVKKLQTSKRQIESEVLVPPPGQPSLLFRIHIYMHNYNFVVGDASVPGRVIEVRYNSVDAHTWRSHFDNY